MLRSFCLLAAVFVSLLTSSEIKAQNRVALVIGNDRYSNLPTDRQLAKAVNDARAVGGALQRLGFNVIRGENLDRGQMVDHIVRFTRAIKPGDTALVFFAGHGVSLSGANYLLPTDIPLPKPGEEVRARNMSLGESDIVADIQASKPRVLVMVLDACRDNPFRQAGLTRSVGGEAGLTRGREAEGVFTIYSAGFGQAALDRLGDSDSSPNSVFTRALIPALARTDVHLADIVIDMREEVARLAATIGHEQYPAYYDQTRGGRIYLSPRTTPGAAAPQVAAISPPQSQAAPVSRAPALTAAPQSIPRPGTKPETIAIAAVAAPPPPQAIPAPGRQPATPANAPVTAPPQGRAPRAVSIARATEIPRCNVFVDAASAGRGNGTLQSPHKTIAAAVAAASPGVAICVTEGAYTEQIKPGEKHLSLFGGFQRGSNFSVRDSAAYVTKAVGRGGSFIRYEDPAPQGNVLTVVDGFDVSGYSQAIVRDFYESQRFDLTNNHIHDNKCENDELVGAGFSLTNVTGRIDGNVIRNNSCGRGGAGFLNDDKQQNTVTIERNLIDNNHGTEPGASHGGALYLFGKTLRITANLFTRNSVTQWGGGLYIGAWTEGGSFTNANLNWNVYRDNRAGNKGGGMFCDDGATCVSYHEVYERNCGGNIYLDGGSEKSGATTAKFDHLTNVGALDTACKAPGPGVVIDGNNFAPDNHAFVNAIFWGNAPGMDFMANCDGACRTVKVNVSYSMVQTKYANNGVTVTFGDGIIAPVDPLFANPAAGDFHLKSTVGRWTPNGYVQDSATSPLIGRGDGAPTESPPRAGNRNEPGAFGNSVEASFVR